MEAVLRRAAQIDAQTRSPTASGLSAEEVTRIALDAGLSPAAVDAAVRELQLGELSKDQKQALLDKYIGPGIVRTAKVVDLPPDEAAVALRRLFEEELLEPLEKQGHRVIWGRRKACAPTSCAPCAMAGRGSAPCGSWSSPPTCARPTPSSTPTG